MALHQVAHAAREIVYRGCCFLTAKCLGAAALERELRR